MIVSNSTKDLESFGVHTAEDLTRWAASIFVPSQSRVVATSKGLRVPERVGWQNLLIGLCEAETVFRHYNSNLKFVVDLCKAWGKKASPEVASLDVVVDEVNGQSVAIQHIRRVARELGMELQSTSQSASPGKQSRSSITPRKAVEELIKAELLQKLGWPCTADLAASVVMLTTHMKLGNTMLMQLSCNCQGCIFWKVYTCCVPT